MTTVLKNVLNFSGLVIGVPKSIPHLLNVNGVAVIPDLVIANAAGYTLAADTVNITVTRGTGGASVGVYVEHWHTIEDSEPPGGLGSNVPFFVESSASSGGGGGGGQAWRYTAVGGETSITTMLPVARPVGDNKYNAIASGGGMAFQTTFDCPVSSYTNTQFVVNFGAALTVGDVILLEITSLT